MEITLLINGEERTFSKKNFTLRENLIAMKHQVKADVYYSDEEALKNPEKYEELQKDLLETISKIFDEQFTDEQLMTGLVIEKADVITDVLVRAMGGNKKDDKKKNKNQ
ncbi:phage tail assembly chaperone G [Enterococcus mundtii]|uniref:Phage protein n=1 Tax=Enterococcus mundtii TaxID=53346 RepID=A0A848MXH6_ENTMU|nr:hypothetical protein [Enterococcus mundtii]NMP58610.1 hypothetical protein [Enterococcus mundtii]